MSKVQQKLFGGEAEEQPKKFKPPRRSHPVRLNLMTPTPLIDPETLDKTPSEEYLGRVKDGLYLWDMRCWDERSREEAAKWVKDLKEGSHDSKNCGHVAWCIRKLLRRGVDEKFILDAMMANKKIQFRSRLVKCFGGGENGFADHPCPKARKAGGYSDCHCEDCEDPKDVKRNFAKPTKRKHIELAEETTGTGTSEQQQKAA